MIGSEGRISNDLFGFDDGVDCTAYSFVELVFFFLKVIYFFH